MNYLITGVLIVGAVFFQCIVPSTANYGLANELEPYVAYAAREGEYTRCGPSTKYYKADPLRAGQEIEVYLETNDDWLGIRPPDNSFSWLQSDQVEVGEDEVTGTIIDSSAYSWIGTHLGRAHKYSWQVRLQVGEQVAIVGTARRDGPDGDEVWYRIVPPPGEFRWLHRSQIVLSQDEVERKARPSETAEIAKDDFDQRPPRQDAVDTLTYEPRERNTKRTENTDSRDPYGIDVDEAPVGSGLASVAPPVPPPITFDEEVLSASLAEANIPVQQPLAVQPAGHDDSSSLRVLATPPSLRSVFDTTGGYQPQNDLINADVETLSVELSRAMAAQASPIEINVLKERCSILTRTLPDAVGRGRAALVLKRIEEYERIALQRQASLPPTTVAPATAITQGAELQDTIGIAAASGQETKFDRQGWLVKVYSARPNAPPYAVTDASGRTLSYVTPVPGINLRRYLNQEVGLYGRLAFDTSLETPHLIAEQAVRLRR